MLEITDEKKLIVESTSKVNDALAQLADASATHETVASGIRDHRETFVLKPEPMSYPQLAVLATKAADEERQVEPFVKVYNYRTWDVALAFSRVCERVYGHPPFAVKDESYTVEIPTSPTQTVTIHYGTLDIPELKGTITHDQTRDRYYGSIGQVIIRVPKKLQNAARGLCKLVEDDLKANSIYKGKAITSDQMPKFLDPYVTNKNQIVWSRSVDSAMRGSVLNVIKHTARAKERGQNIHRSVLFFGEPGNGKSESINIVAQTCVENGWTYVLTTTTLSEALQTARLLAPAVISAEDFERLVNQATEEERSAVLEELDGTSSKGQDIMLVTTTNFVTDLEKAVRRRMFKEIEFGPFDPPGTEKFLRLKLDGQTAKDTGNSLEDVLTLPTEYPADHYNTMDYPVVALSMDGWGNSYISKVIDFAAGLALEHDSPELTTADLLDAVEAQKPDWEGYLSSLARPVPNKLDDVLGDLFTQALSDKVKGFWEDDDLVFSKK